MAELSKMTVDALEAEHDRLGEQMRALQLRQIAVGAELDGRRLLAGAEALLAGMDDAQRGAVTLAVQHMGVAAPKPKGAGE